MTLIQSACTPLLPRWRARGAHGIDCSSSILFLKNSKEIQMLLTWRRTNDLSITSLNALRLDSWRLVEAVFLLGSWDNFPALFHESCAIIREFKTYDTTVAKTLLKIASVSLSIFFVISGC